MVNELQKKIWQIQASLPEKEYQKFVEDANAFLETYNTGECNPMLCKKLRNVTVGDLKDALKDFPYQAKVTICGLREFYIHITHDKDTVIIDIESNIDGYTDLGNKIKDMVVEEKEEEKYE